MPVRTGWLGLSPPGPATRLVACGVLTWQVTQGSLAQEGAQHPPSSSLWCRKCEVTF